MTRKVIFACVTASLILFSFTSFLSTKSKTKSFRYILTGGPGAGKTSILLKLEQLGHGIVREAATDMASLYIAQGKEQPWLCTDFDDHILQLQSERQSVATFYPKSRIFFDRSPLDVLAYCERFGQADPDFKKRIVNTLQKGSYAPIVFLVENFGSCKKTAVRSESIQEALQLQQLQEKNYREHGFSIVRVPPGSVDERAQFILAFIADFEKNAASGPESFAIGSIASAAQP